MPELAADSLDDDQYMNGNSAETAGPNSLKVLIVSHYFWPEPFRITQLAQDLVAQGAQVTVLTGHPSYPEGASYPGYRAWTTRRENTPRGIAIFRVPVVPRGRSSAVRLALNYVSFVISGVLIAPWMLRRSSFDAIFVFCTTPVTQGLVAIWLKFLRRVPVVQWVQDIWPEALSATGYLRSPHLLRLMGGLTSWMYRRSDLVLAQSHSFVRILRQRSGETPVEYFPNPGEHALPEMEPGLVLPEGNNIVFAGNIGRAQAIETVIAAAALIDGRVPVRLVLVGSGSMLEWAAREVARLRLQNVLLPGRHPAAAMPGTFRSAFALLLSLTDDPAVSQTVPSKLQSYLAAGRPIIAAVNGDAAHLTERAGAGLACRADDPQALADVIRKMVSLGQDERDEMGRSGREFYLRNFEPTKLADDLHRRLVALVKSYRTEM